MAFFQSKSSTVSSLSADHHKEWDGLSHNEVHEIRVDVLCINDVLKCINTPPDLLLIDAEGEDERIVRSINYENFGPHILMIEMDHMTNSCLLIKFLRQKGYLEYATVANNKIFVKKETWETRNV